MASWEDQQVMSTSTPPVKLEPSPAESFLSTPGEMYPSLFDNTTADLLSSIMTPRSLTGEDIATSSVATSSVAASSPAATPAPCTPGSQCADSEKRPAKKRKSWGQVLPEPKTNLPPRKRAKTEDEKEQRRVERVLRNRRAAQSSRERKRQEVEALEQRNAALEAALLEQRKHNVMLLEQLTKLQGTATVGGQSPSLDAFQPPPLTLSQSLYQGSAGTAARDESAMEDFILLPEQDGTVNLASISPELNPIPDTNLKTPSTTATEAETGTAPTTAGTSSDVTQHPAAMLCDLQCPSVGTPPSWVASNPMFQLQTLLMVSSLLISAFRRPLTLISGALKTNLALQPTPLLLSTIIWLVTLPPLFPNSTSVNSSVTKITAQSLARWRDTTPSLRNRTPVSASSTLRIKSLQKLLTSSPILARPLMDATMEFLRLVSEGRDDRVEGLANGSPDTKGDQSRGLLFWPEGTSLPSREVLLTLLWAIRVEERRQSSQEKKYASSPSSRPRSSVFQKNTPTNHPIVLSTVLKEKGDDSVNDIGKRLRLSFGF
ncbi:hypothetical protein GGS20DRAFT_576043 [Poronia punctata]|nr:hypothetical protein GGS20DRAFT_576043 [Poronia punctata]